jgi:predicted metal-dependent peptidase
VPNRQSYRSSNKWDPGDQPAEAVRRWSSETLYNLLSKNAGLINLRALDPTGLAGGDLATTPRDAKTEDGVTAGDEVRAWAFRLKAARSSLAGVLSRLASELPKVRTPWELILRGLLFRHARRRRRPDSSRPTRRWLALEGELREHEGVNLPFERATTAGRTGRIALAVDTSGSIGESLLDRFAAEVAAVLDQTEPLLRLIVCDAKVHRVHEFSSREGAKALREFQFRGGGGTDFRPAIAEAAKWKPDLLIYLTDLEGPTGDEPAFPVLWAVPEGKSGAPWGRIVELS